MDNLNIYNQVRAVPKEAQKEIKGGRMSGKTDINPMWRIRKLTEIYGPCGVGWKYVILKQWLEDGSNGEIAAFVNIDLYVKHEGAWSEAIPGTGGNMFVAMEKDKDIVGGKKPYVSDECFKMALTDAISVSCKALGFGADVYWQADSTKYSRPESVGNSNMQGRQSPPPTGQPSGSQIAKASPSQIRKIAFLAGQKNINEEQGKALIMERYKKNSTQDLDIKQASDFIDYLSGDKHKAVG